MAFKMNTPSMINISYKNQSSGISPLRQVESSPADKKPPTDWKDDKQSLLNQFRKLRTKVGNRVRKVLGEPNFNDEPQSIKKEHSDLFSKNVH